MKYKWDNEAMAALTKLPVHARRAVMAVESYKATDDVIQFYRSCGECLLDECPPGVILTPSGILAVMTEYNNDSGEPLAYTLGTGERLDIASDTVTRLQAHNPICDD